MNVNDLIKNYSLIDDMSSFVTIINNTFNEEQKINILRNETFIKDITPELLELILSNMKFESVFNMLQNKKILEKINNINVNINETYKGLIISYLNSDSLIKKTSSIMLTKLLLKLDKEEINNYLSNIKIKEKLNNDDIIYIATNKNIILDNINKLNNDELYLYINNMLFKNKNIDIINNKDSVKKLFNINNKVLNKINFSEVKYLYETINTKSIITIQDNTYNVNNYKGILSLYLFYGFDNAKRIANQVQNFTIKDANNLINDLTNQKLYQFKLDNYQLFDNMPHKVINELKKDNNINNIINNPYLKNIISLSRIYNYDILINNIQSYYKEDINNRDIKMYNIINSFVNNIYNIQKNKYYINIKNKISKDFNIKSNILYNLKNNLTTSYIKSLKMKILINTLKDNNKVKYQDFYKNKIDIININNIYCKKLSHNEIDLNSIIKYVLYPYANNTFNIDVIINNLGLENNKDYKDIINSIINKTINFNNYYIDTTKTKIYFYKDINNYIDNMHLNIPFNHYYFEPQKKILSISDYAKLFSGYDLNKSITHKKSIYNFIKKNNLLISYSNKYLDETFDLGFVISNYDDLYNKHKNNITLSNINYLIYNNLNNPILKKISINTYNYLFENNHNINIENILNRYTNNLLTNDLNIPFIKGITNNISYELINNHDEEILKYKDNYNYLRLKDIVTNKIISIIKIERINNILIINTNNKIDNTIINNIGNELLNNIPDINIVLTNNINYYGININSKLLKLPEKEYKIICSNKDIDENINDKIISNKYPRKRNKYKVISNILTNKDIVNLETIISLYSLDKSILNNTYSEIYYGDDWIITKSLKNEIQVYNQNKYNEDEINSLLTKINKVEQNVLLLFCNFNRITYLYFDSISKEDLKSNIYLLSTLLGNVSNS